MLFSAAIANAVADHFEEKESPPLVVDPVMIATSGASRLSGTGETASAGRTRHTRNAHPDAAP
jgi:hydroxymethylpyrimidine/phosphomethylpyrimidine kinase